MTAGPSRGFQPISSMRCQAGKVGSPKLERCSINLIASCEKGVWNAGRAVRAADGAGLENQWAEMSRGFESHALRHRKEDLKDERFSPTFLSF